MKMALQNNARKWMRIVRFVALLLLWLPLINASPPFGNTGGADIEKYLSTPAVFLRIGDNDIEKYAIKRVQPDYPVLAQKHKIEGIVVVDVKVGSDGKVTDAQFVNGHSVFRAVSLDAAKQWEFRKGSDVEGTIRFTFKLR